jgi:hypothetical protein
MRTRQARIEPDEAKCKLLKLKMVVDVSLDFLRTLSMNSKIRVNLMDMGVDAIEAKGHAPLSTAERMRNRCVLHSLKEARKLANVTIMLEKKHVRYFLDSEDTDGEERTLDSLDPSYEDSDSDTQPDTMTLFLFNFVSKKGTALSEIEPPTANKRQIRDAMMCNTP